MKLPEFFKKIRVQISLNSLGTGLFTILLIGFILYFSLSSIVLRQSVNSTEMAIQKSGDYIDLYIDRLKAISLMIVEDSRTISYLGGSGLSTITSKEDILDMIDTTMKTDLYIKSIIIVGKNGEVVSNEQSLNMSMSGDMMKEDWYVEAIKSGSMPHLTSARMQKFSMDKENWVISISREITDKNDDNIGVLVLDIQYKVIEDYLNDLDLGREGCAFIINDSGNVVYHKDPAYFNDEILQNELIQISKMAEGYNADSKTLVQSFHLKNSDWTLIGISSLDELAGVKRQLIETLIIVSIVLAIIVIGSGTYFAGKITDPIRKLELAMEDIENGLKKVEISDRGSFEARSLAKQFNKMIIQIEELMDEVANKEKYLREYELKVLHSQINPHFLYNTLDTIVWMAEFNDSEKVIAITKALARFFRLSLSGGSELTTVKNEFEHVSRYLFIQKERYAEKLEYELTFDPEIEQAVIPKIILQPFVENAIYHGIRGLEGTGHIWVIASKIEDGIEFTIKDDGEGFEVRHQKNKSRGNEVKLGGVGIENVNKRVKLYYGDNYGVEVRSKVGEGTKVIIKVGMEISDK